VILVRYKPHSFDLVGCPYFKCCVVITLKNLLDNFVWRWITVYGSLYEDSKMEFVNELHTVMGAW
jgi:hypothetical protein